MVNKKLHFVSKNPFELKGIAVLIQKASTFRSSIWIVCNGRRANAKSLLGIMSLSLASDTDIEVIAEGPDETSALESISEYLSNPVF